MSWISQLPTLASVPQARSDDFARFISTAVFRSARAVRHPGGQSIRCATVLSTEHAFFSQLPSPHIARTALYRAPFEQAKLVHCVCGRLFDVVVDMRENSPTFRAWKSFQLDADRAQSVWIPAGYADGFLTLEHVKLLKPQSTWRQIDWPKNNRIAYRPCFGEHCCEAK